MKRDQDKPQTGVEQHSEEAVRKYALNPTRLALLARMAGFPCDVEEDGVTLETDAGTVHLEHSDLFQTLSFRTWIGTEWITHPEDLLLIVGRMNRSTIGTRFHLLEDDPETIECELFHLCEGSRMNAITLARLLHRLVCDVNAAVTIMSTFEFTEQSAIRKLRIDCP
jgi:hypothetical protein